jgi:hypothetical protein
MFTSSGHFDAMELKHCSQYVEPAMLENDFEKFRELVLRDAKLQEILRQPLRDDAFIEAVVRLGAERGFGFTVDEVQDAMRTSRRAWLERWI